MKKSVLVTSILFSTMMLGTNVLVNDTNIKATEKSEMINDETVSNKIKFIDQEGIVVKPSIWDHDSDGFDNHIISGKIGDNINLDSILPDGYELNDNSQKIKFSKSSKVIRIQINAKEVTNTINFVTEDDEKVGSTKLSGKVGKRKKILDEDIPKGYRILNSSVANYGINLVFKDEAITIKVVKNEINKNITLNFVDEEGTLISSRIDSFPTGERVNAQYISLPNDYELSKNQSLDFAVTDEVDDVTIIVKKNILTNILDVTDNDKIVETVKIKGELGTSVDISGRFSSDYDLVNSSEKNVTIGKDGTHITVKVKRNTIRNKIEFKDTKGRIVGQTDREGRKGEKEYIYQSVPDNYFIKNDEDNILEFKNDNETISITVLQHGVTNTINFKASDGTVVKSEEVTGNEENEHEIDYFVPDDYYLENEDNKNIFLKGDGESIDIRVLKKVRNKIEFVTIDGKPVDNYYDLYFYGKVDELKKVEPISGYSIIKNDTIKLNSKDGYVHTIVLEGKKVDTELVFFENGKADKKPISKEKYSGKFGDNLPSKCIPDGYVLLHGKYQLTDQPTQTVLLRKIVKTKVNYVNSFGVIIGKQEFIKPNHIEVQLSVPKGYSLVNNPNNVLRIDGDIPVQNVLVVPSNGVQMPELPNIVSTQINLINRKDNKVIHSYVAQGIHGQSMNIQIPTGYDLAKGVTNKLTLDKSKKLVNIYMVEKEVTNTTGVTVPHSKTVLTKKTAHLYDKNGKEVTNRALGINSGWKSDQMMVLNGETYYRVATNEYVKVSDIVEYQMNVSTVKTSSGSAKYLYDVNGKKSSDRALAANTAWFTDKAAVINGEKMYRVATNEWVKASDID